MNIAFDTLYYANKLKQASMAAKLAEVQAEALAEIVQEKIVTKEHFDASLKDIDARFKDIDMRFEKVDMQFEKVDMQFEKVDMQFREVDAKFKELEYRLTIKLGSMMILAVSVVATLVKVL